MRYEYPCDIVRDVEEFRSNRPGGIHCDLVPDVPPAITDGLSWRESLELAADCLGGALGFYVKLREDIPEPSPATDGQVMIEVPPIVAAKLALYTAMRKQGIANVALASSIGRYRKCRTQAR